MRGRKGECGWWCQVGVWSPGVIRFGTDQSDHWAAQLPRTPSGGSAHPTGERAAGEQPPGRGGVSAQDLVFLTHQPTEWSWVPMCPWSLRGLSSLTLC